MVFHMLGLLVRNHFLIVKTMKSGSQKNPEMGTDQSTENYFQAPFFIKGSWILILDMSNALFIGLQNDNLYHIIFVY